MTKTMKRPATGRPTNTDAPILTPATGISHERHMRRHALARRALDHALAEYVATAAGLETPGLPVADLLSLARHAGHIQLDLLNDAAANRHHVTLFAPPYNTLARAVGWAR